MKKFLFSISFLTICAGMFSSCDKEDDEEKNKSTQKHVATMSNYRGNYVEYEFDSNGRIKSVVAEYINTGNGKEEYDYNTLTVKGVYGNEIINGNLNSDGTIAKVSSTNQSMFCTYDATKHLTNIDYKTVIDYDNIETRSIKYIWENGNITSSELTLGGISNGFDKEPEVLHMSYKYTSEKYPTPIENKGNLLLNFYSFSDYNSFISGTGVTSKNLPVAINRGSGTFEDIEYVFEDGYPVKITFADITINYTWK